MIKKAVRSLVILLFTAGLLSSYSVMGQSKDAGLWTSVSIEAKLNKRLSAALSQEFRFNENISELGTVFTDAGLDYKLNKHFEVAVNYRYIHKHRVDDSYSKRHRFYADIKYAKKFKPLQLQLRSRLQDEYADFGRASDGGTPEFYLRNKFRVKYDTKKPYSPYLSVELFSPLSYPRSSAFDNIRSTAGIDYDLTKHHKIDLFYMIQRELNVSSPSTDFVIGIGYSYKL